jgi:hypothetical protein
MTDVPTVNLLSSIAPPPKSKTERLAELLPAIEGAIAAGHSEKAIHEHVVNNEGLDLTFRYYKLTLHRVRKKRDKLLSEAPAMVAHHGPKAPVRPPAQLTAAVSEHVSEKPKKFAYDVLAPVDDFFS